jgi:Uma2 family endonuclease
MASQQEAYITPEQYLEMERAAASRSEYYDGRIYPMAGASPNHERIVANVLRELGVQLRGRPCDLFGSNIGIRVPETGLYTYADASALCGEPRFDGVTDLLLNPTVLIEVLSPSTEAYDRGKKFDHYRKLPSLREYVLLAQDRVHADRFVRDGERWPLMSFDGPDAMVVVPSIDCVLQLRDVYERVELPPNPPLRAVHEEAPRYAVAASA